jgi:hypothetical protein
MPSATLSAGFLLSDEQINGLRMTHPPATSLHQFAKDSAFTAKLIRNNAGLEAESLIE